MALGLIDSMRIQLDRPMPPCTVWEHYSGWYNSVIPAVAKRYYFHRNAWINDPDHLRTRDLTIPQAQAAATILGLAGGTVISGDRLYDLDVERLGILKKILPSYGQTARPLDLFDTPLAETFALKIEKPFGAWWLVGCFNGTPDPLSRPLHLPSLGMDPRRSHLVYDFWTQKLLGKYQDLITVSLEPTSVRLLVIREQLSIPQVLGTDRHITAGAVELDEVKWNPETNTLSGIAVGGPSMNWTLAVHCAQDYSFDDREGACTGFRSVRKNGEVLRGMIQFDKADRVQWSLRFKAVQRTLTE